MVSRIRSLGIQGVSGYEVSVECALSGGLPHFDIVGLPDAAVKEARDRVRAAIKHCGMDFPVSRLTINLAPADTRKAGTVYDLPVLLGVLAASGQIDKPPDAMAFFGELALNGEVRPVRGALPMALAAARAGIGELFVPDDNGEEAAFAENITVYRVKDVQSLLEHLRGGEKLETALPPAASRHHSEVRDFAEVKGQQNVKRALEIAAAGGHNVLLIGPPGAGKSMLARRLPGILPAMTKSEMTESTEIWSVMGLTNRAFPVLSERPFRSPHHTLSNSAMSGGATLLPGEISLAHNGVLFLDELPEFRRDVIETLRQPLEDGVVTIARASGTAAYPCRFTLVCAMNPCPCGWYGHGGGRCRCTEQAIRRYRSKISGPLLDRLDLLVEVQALQYSELRRRGAAESSAQIRERVNAARDVQNLRFSGTGTDCNARMGPKELDTYCALTKDCEELMKDAFDALRLTARSYDKVLRVARTIADLAGDGAIGPGHLAEAVQFRTFDFTEDRE